MSKVKEESKYKNKAGVGVPRTTEIIGEFKSSETVDALSNWAYGLGMRGEDRPNKVRDKAGEEGTAHHLLFQSWIEKKEPALDDSQPTAYWNFRLWLRANKDLTFDRCEVSLVSEALQSGGSLDCVGKNRIGENILLDWKTSNALHGNYIPQAGAYAEYLRECEGIEVVEARIVRFDKKNICMDQMVLSKDDLKSGLEEFKALRIAYDPRQKNEERMKEYKKNNK
jgi:hypothetical protein